MATVVVVVVVAAPEGAGRSLTLCSPHGVSWGDCGVNWVDCEKADVRVEDCRCWYLGGAEWLLK
jgi:hypothetical protein